VDGCLLVLGVPQKELSKENVNLVGVMHREMFLKNLDGRRSVSLESVQVGKCIECL